MPDTTDRALVTGGAGFIGSHVTERLLDRGLEVHVLDNLIAGTDEHVPSQATLHEVDLRDDRVGQLVRELDPSIVLHLAARHYIPYCNDHPEETFEVNVMGTRSLCDALRECDRLDSLVYASSAAVYPPRDRAHAEHDPAGPMDIYGRTKLVGEDIVELFARDTDVPTVSARLFNVYGPNETNPHLIPAILEQLEDGNRSIELGNLSPARDFVYAEDVADAFVTLADESDVVTSESAGSDGSYRIYNVGTGTAYTVRKVAEAVGEALGDDLVVSQATERVRESDRPHLCADTTRIERETGWQPRTEFVDGLRDLLRSEGFLG